MVDGGQNLTDVALGAGEGAGTMSGVWLLVDEGSSCVLGIEQLVASYFVVELTQSGKRLTETRTLCRQEYTELLGLKIVLSDEARKGIEFRQLETGLINELQVGGTYSSGTIAALWGLNLENPYTDAIPEDSEDPQVVDGDGDGNPAITFSFEGSSCERYTAQKQLFRYQGTLVRPNAVEGVSMTVTDVVVYDSSQPLCGIAPQVRSNDPSSRFRMVRADGVGGSPNADLDADGEITCDEADRFFDSLIERREADPERCEVD